jgi:transcriptional regulator with PAS, ATPase and Fis domain
MVDVGVFAIQIFAMYNNYHKYKEKVELFVSRYNAQINAEKQKTQRI